ncbi:transposase family protein [Streptomyces sp. NPDC003343]
MRCVGARAGLRRGLRTRRSRIRAVDRGPPSARPARQCQEDGPTTLADRCLSLPHLRTPGTVRRPAGLTAWCAREQERPGHDVKRAVRVGETVTSSLARIALWHPICTGISRRRLGALIAESAAPWIAQQDCRRHERRGHERLRPESGGPGHQLVFTDRMIAALVVLRFQLPHAALAVFYGVDRSSITRAVHEIRPLLAARGFAVPGEVGLRLHTMADVFAYASAQGVELRVDRTEVRVRRPKAGRPAAGPSSPARCSRTRRRSPLSPPRSSRRRKPGPGHSRRRPPRPPACPRPAVGSGGSAWAAARRAELTPAQLPCAAALIVHGCCGTDGRRVPARSVPRRSGRAG